MHDVVEFLRRHAPFDELAEEELERLARAAEVEFFPAGERIFRQGAEPMEHLWMIRRGAVELRQDDRVLDALGEGELLGHPWMLAGLPAGFEAQAAEDTLCYRFPADAVLPLLARPDGLRYVARSLADRMRAAGPGTAEGSGMDLDPAHQPVARLARRRPVICDANATVRDAARSMAEAEQGAALVRVEDGRLGIVTDRDLRDRVVAGGIGADAPVAQVATVPAFTVTPERLGAEVMLEMIGRDIHHVPVVWPHGEVLGMLTDRELLLAESRAPLSLRRTIQDAGDIEAVRRASSELRPTVVALHDAGTAPTRIASIVGALADALTQRLIELTIAELGPPPCPFSWLALGSIGRREVAPSSDFDSGLVWDGEGDADQRYMRELGRRIVGELGTAGFVADAHGATAAEPLFDRSFAAWRRIVRTSIEDPDRDKALVFISLLSDARPVYVDGAPRDPLEELGQVWHRRPLLRLMLRLALAHRPPTGLRRLRGGPPRDLVVERSGEHRGRFDIKHGGLLPIVGIARYASLAAGVRLTSTRERLDFAATADVLDGRDARVLEEAFELFWRLRLDHQVEQLRAGLEPDNFIDADGLNPVTRGYVREAFHATSGVQRSLAGELSLPPP